MANRDQDPRYASPAKTKPVERSFDSTMVRHASWTEASQILDLEFVDGTKYRYRQITSEVWRNLLNATSVGHFVNTTLGHYPHGRL